MVPSALLHAANRYHGLGLWTQQHRGIQHPVLLGARKDITVHDKDTMAGVVDGIDLID